MTNKNDITGDKLITKTATDSYRDGWDRIFGKKKKIKQDYLRQIYESGATAEEGIRFVLESEDALWPSEARKFL